MYFGTPRILLDTSMITIFNRALLNSVKYEMISPWLWCLLIFARFPCGDNFLISVFIMGLHLLRTCLSFLRRWCSQFQFLRYQRNYPYQRLTGNNICRNRCIAPRQITAFWNKIDWKFNPKFRKDSLGRKSWIVKTLVCSEKQLSYHQASVERFFFWRGVKN